MKLLRLTKDKNEYQTIKCVVLPKENGKYGAIVFEDVLPIIFGEIQALVDLPTEDKDINAWTYMCDLQEGNDYCFIAYSYNAKDNSYLELIGNGWCEKLGFPYLENGKYPIISGKTKETLMDLFKRNLFTDWDNVFSGNFEDLFIRIF